MRHPQTSPRRFPTALTLTRQLRLTQSPVAPERPVVSTVGAQVSQSTACAQTEPPLAEQDVLTAQGDGAASLQAYSGGTESALPTGLAPELANEAQLAQVPHPHSPPPLSGPALATATPGTHTDLLTVLAEHGFGLENGTIGIPGESGALYLSSTHYRYSRRCLPAHGWGKVATGTVLYGPTGPVVVIVLQTTGRSRVNRYSGRPTRAAALADATALTDRLLAALALARIPTLVDCQVGDMLRHRDADVPFGLYSVLAGLREPEAARLRLGPVLSDWLAGGQLLAQDRALSQDIDLVWAQVRWLRWEDNLIRYQGLLTDADQGELAIIGAGPDTAAGDLLWEDLRTLPADRLHRVGEFVAARCKRLNPDSWTEWPRTF